MQRQLAAFVAQPSKSTYLAARDAVLCQSPIPLCATDLSDIEQLLDGHQYQSVVDRLDLLPPSRVLSPRVHYLAAEAAAALGEEEEVELERSLFVLTLQGLLATGDGSEGNPYSVCHVSDEYDVVDALGAEPASQSLVEQNGRWCDVILCSDGREIHFDVTELVDMKKRGRPPMRRRRVPRQGGVVRRRRLRARR